MPLWKSSLGQLYEYVFTDRFDIWDQSLCQYVLPGGWGGGEVGGILGGVGGGWGSWGNFGWGVGGESLTECKGGL